MQDSELPVLSFVPISVKPNTYSTFQDGAVFRNFQWFYGQLAWSESKFTKTFEGFFNTHTKTAVLENYDVFLRKMPDWYAKELSNVLGGTSLSVWKNGKKTRHTEFECTELTLQKDKKSCLVLASSVKLQSVNKTILNGCYMQQVLDPYMSVGCLNFLNANVDTFTYFYTSELRNLQLGLNMGYATDVTFSMFAFRSDDPNTLFDAYTIVYTGVTNINVVFDTFLVGAASGDGLVIRTAQQNFVSGDFDVTWVFKAVFQKPISCPTSQNYGFSTKAINFRTVISRIETGNLTAVQSPQFRSKEMSII